MSAPGWFIGIGFMLLAGCVSVDTGSVVSRPDVPASRYHHIVVFVENISDGERAGTEQLFVTALQNAGVRSQSSRLLFQDTSRTLTSDEMATLIRDQKFDAVLYVTVLRMDLVQEPVPDVWFDGQMFHGKALGGFVEWGSNTSIEYAVGPNGGVVRPRLTLITKSEVQDVLTAKAVWAADTTASANAKYSTMKSLLEQASTQVVEKMRSDHTI